MVKTKITAIISVILVVAAVLVGQRIDEKKHSIEFVVDWQSGVPFRMILIQYQLGMSDPPPVVPSGKPWVHMEEYNGVDPARLMALDTSGGNISVKILVDNSIVCGPITRNRTQEAICAYNWSLLH